MWTNSLLVDPGKVFVYSSVDDIVLASIIEHVTGMRYEQYFRQVALVAPLVPSPAGVSIPVVTQ